MLMQKQTNKQKNTPGNLSIDLSKSFMLWVTIVYPLCAPWPIINTGDLVV